VVDGALATPHAPADALAHAHAQGVIHRDVKPANILLHQGHALLADFGVAREPSDEQLTDSGLPVGTAAYASPEQAAGSRLVDARSDVYALGCVLYEMLAGGPAHELLKRRFAEALPSLSGLRPDAPAWLDRVLARAMAPRPEDRFTTAAEFRDALTPPAELAAAPPVPTEARKRPSRLWWMGLGAAGLAAIGAALAFLPGRLSTADSRQVVVAGFENRTGDPALAPVSDIAIDYIARGLAATRLLRQVYDARATALEAGQPVRLGIAAGRELAKRVGAGIVLGGSYYVEGDSLHFEAQLVDAGSGSLLLSLEPVVGPVREKSLVVERLRQRVMAGFAVVLRPAFEGWSAASVPPTYEAYQEMLAAGDDLWVFKNDVAIEHLRRAIARDPSYVGAKASLAYALAGMGSCGEVDSVARVLARTAEPLPPADRGRLVYAEAVCRRDVEAKLAAAKAVLVVAPHSVGFTVLAGISAIESSRPREGLEILRRFDAAHTPLSPQQRGIYWSFVGYAYHDLGDYRGQLDANRASHAASDAGPSLEVERGRALAAMGDAKAVRRLVEGWLDHPDPETPVFERAECVALELHAHGNPTAASTLLERIATARGSSGAGDSGDEPCLWNLFSAHYYAGRWDEARTAYARKAAEDTGDVKAHAALAALAARRGDQAILEEQRRWLSARGTAPAKLALARVAALQGRREEAVTLLREAMRDGIERHFLHIDPDFESVRDFPAYRELLRPKG
jgi:tetratricopeptide (TPR) repeat protein/TolB-like protein